MILSYDWLYPMMEVPAAVADTAVPAIIVLSSSPTLDT